LKRDYDYLIKAIGMSEALFTIIRDRAEIEGNEAIENKCKEALEELEKYWNLFQEGE